MDTSCTFVIASSGSVAEKTGDKMEDYNNAAFQARDGAVAYNDAKGTKCANLADVIQHERKASGSDNVKQAIIDVLEPLDDGNSMFTRRLFVIVHTCHAWALRVDAIDIRVVLTCCPPWSPAYPKEAGKRKYAKGALVQRFTQFYIENEEVVAQVAKAFDAADFAALGKLVDTSQVYVGELGKLVHVYLRYLGQRHTCCGFSNCICDMHSSVEPGHVTDHCSGGMHMAGVHRHPPAKHHPVHAVAAQAGPGPWSTCRLRVWCGFWRFCVGMSR